MSATSVTLHPKELSCALLVESPAGWLIAHATGTSRWDLPKGRSNVAEAPKQAALRECLEETGLDFSAHEHQLEDFGQHGYLPKKDLHLFRLKIGEVLDLSGCFCSTKCVRGEGDEVDETDAWEWVPKEKLHERVGKSLVTYLQDLNLLGPVPRAQRRHSP